MEKIRSSNEFVYWTLDERPIDADEFLITLDGLGSLIDDDLWTLCFLNLMCGSTDLAIRHTGDGVRIRSTASFSEQYGVKLSIKMSAEAFSRFQSFPSRA